MNRRAFLMWVGVGWVASSLPVALAACSSQTESVAETTKEFQSIGTIAELDQNGQLLKEKSTVGAVLVVRADLAGNLKAVNPTCTHAGCTVAWQKSPKKFTCPCHGSEFDSDGKVVKGPAAKPLKTYQAKIEGNSVLVKES